MRTQQLRFAKAKTQIADDIACSVVRKGSDTMKAVLPLQFAQNKAKRMAQRVVIALAVMAVNFSAHAGIIAVDLDSASDFAILAGAGITIAGAAASTEITGDIGTFPTTTVTGIANVILNGVNHAGDANTQSAKDALAIAYNDAAGRSATWTYGAVYDLGGSTLTSGVYNNPTSFGITGILTLDGGGDPNAVWIFQVGSTLTTASYSKINLINGAQAANVFWQVGSAATLGSYSDFSGTIMANAAITLITGTTLDGRAMSQDAAVNLDSNVVIPEPASLVLIGLGAACMFMFRRTTGR